MISKNSFDPIDRAALLLSIHKYQEIISILEPYLQELRRSSIKDSQRLRQTEGTLGIAYNELGHLEKARACFEETIKLARKSKDKEGLAVYLQELSLVFWKENLWKEAVDLFREAIGIQIENSSETPAILKALSFTYEDTKDFDKAKRMIEYCANRKKLDPEFEKGFEEGYKNFKIGVLLRQARINAGLTQENIAEKLKTKKSAISRIENHAEDIRLSTLHKYAGALGKSLHVIIR